jgi:hypothetical protein
MKPGTVVDMNYGIEVEVIDWQEGSETFTGKVLVDPFNFAELNVPKVFLKQVCKGVVEDGSRNNS